jgi:iron uptake system component EfeO
LSTSPLTRRRLLVGGGIAVVAAAVTAGVLIWSQEDPRPAAAGPQAVTAGASNCGKGWTPHAGDQTLQVVNRGTVATDVEVIEVPSGAVHGEIEGLGVGLTRSLRVVLGGGDFAIRCGVEDIGPFTGPTVHIAGPRGAPGVVPVTVNDLTGPLRAYTGYVANGLTTLVNRTTALRDAVRAGDLRKARSAWLPAHVAYIRLGAAYGAFGDTDGLINGGPGGLPRGVADPDFTGFRRLEYGLWHGQSAKTLTPVADKLTTNVVALRRDFPRSQIDPRDLGLRAHEILEDVDRETLTGGADQGSGSELAEVAASLDGTRELVGVLRPVLTTRYPAMSEVDTGMKRLDALLAGLRPYRPLAALSRTDRARLNGAVGDLVEKLAPVAVICEPRRTS